MIAKVGDFVEFKDDDFGFAYGLIVEEIEHTDSYLVERIDLAMFDKLVIPASSITVVHGKEG